MPNDLPHRPPRGKIRWKAYFHPKNSNPFTPHGVEVLTQTVDVDAAVNKEEIENFAREIQGENTFLRVEVVQ